MNTPLAALLLVLSLGTIACGEYPSSPDPEVISPSVARVAGTACLRPIIASAVVVGHGLALTVAHAIAGADDDLSIITLERAEHAVRVVGFDPDRDLALLSVDGLDAPALPFGSAVAGDVGVIAAVSGALELNLIEYHVLRVVEAHSGNIYDQGRVERAALDIEADIAPGVSGAALIDADGAIVGMVFAESRDREGGAYALEASEIRSFLDSVDVGTVVEAGRCR